MLWTETNSKLTTNAAVFDVNSSNLYFLWRERMLVPHVQALFSLNYCNFSFQIKKKDRNEPSHPHIKSYKRKSRVFDQHETDVLIKFVMGLFIIYFVFRVKEAINKHCYQHTQCMTYLQNNQFQFSYQFSHWQLTHHRRSSYSLKLLLNVSTRFWFKRFWS